MPSLRPSPRLYEKIRPLQALFQGTSTQRQYSGSEEGKLVTLKKNMKVVNYPVGDFLIRIKNAALADKRELDVSETKLIKAVADVLKKEGYLEKVTEKQGKLNIRLAYRRKKPVLFKLKLVSKPGLRVYMTVKELEKIKGPSIFILSTPKGVISSQEAKKERLGGEVIVEIW